MNLENFVQLNEQPQELILSNDVKLKFDFTPSLHETKRLLILINGFQRTRQDFRSFRKKLKELSPHTATISFDNRLSPGETEVSHSLPFSLADIAQDALLLSKIFQKKLNVNSWSVLGISMGGMVAQIISCLETDHFLKNIFLVSTTAGGPERIFPSHFNKNIHKEYSPYENLLHVQKSMKYYFGPKFLSRSQLFFETLCKTILNTQKNQHSFANPKEQFRESLNFDVRLFLNPLKTKLTSKKFILISGDCDDIIPVENLFLLEKIYSNSESIIYPDMGHLLLIENPEQFVSDVAKRLNDSTLF